MAQGKPVGQPDEQEGAVDFIEILITDDIVASPEDMAEFKRLFDQHEAAQKTPWTPGEPMKS